MSNPVAFILYVSDAETSARFYGDLLGQEPRFLGPRYVTFDLAPRTQLALWGGEDAKEALTRAQAATSEVCLFLPGGPEGVDQRHAQWVAKGVKVVEEPHDAPFGRTFLVADPDGNQVRVAPAA